eukprot:CAMPEP_0206577654 /NCGR_PEP_ID=MMETSP0325_2-20121206/31492_1 /ASSEMBLY_ACC=CAM_ASM_000347 /TAXON_ID=2866 /ORGANISM="Crypthecodinium cohnii, Strain Seligo" /LENGTH=32 /DNA_ID= /DNA_START= /DNA_END= /DNA_ORIENTATION=
MDCYLRHLFQKSWPTPPELPAKSNSNNNKNKK